MHISDLKRMAREKIRSDEVIGTCRYCKGTIIETFGWQIEPLTRSTPIGGQRHREEISLGYHCSDCGLHYHHVPYEYLTDERKLKYQQQEVQRCKALADRLNPLLGKWGVELTPVDAMGWFQFVAGRGDAPSEIAAPAGSSELPKGDPLECQHFLEEVASLFISWGINWERIDQGAALRLYEMLHTIIPADKGFIKPPLLSNSWIVQSIETRNY